MLRLLICSVGTSLLSGKDRPWKWSPGGARELPDSRVVQEWLEQADPVQASAETNTLSRLEVGSADRIVFLHSDTPDGTYCAVRLAEYYRSRARAVELKRIGQLGYGAKSFFARVEVVDRLDVRAGEAGLAQQYRGEHRHLRHRRVQGGDRVPQPAWGAPPGRSGVHLRAA